LTKEYCRPPYNNRNVGLIYEYAEDVSKALKNGFRLPQTVV